MVESYNEPLSEYAKLTSLLENDKITKNDAYIELMKKEGNILKTINRVVDHEQVKHYESKLFYNLPLLTVLALFINTWKNIFIELATTRDFTNYEDVYEVFTKKDRKIYVGLMMFVVALSLYMIDVY